jgi:hypothetical protein
MPLVRYEDGPAVYLRKTSRIEKPKATSAQTKADRNLLWLQAYEFGLHDPITGCTRPRSTWEIARIWKAPIRTVQHGISSAIRLRNRIRDAIDRDD